MTKLPAKELLDGSKVPKTTTGEMKDALGKLRDYLGDLLGEDSTDKGAARQKLGLDLMAWTNRLDAKADKETVETAMQAKADKTEVENRATTLEEKIAERGVPVGSIDWFAMTAPPMGYLKADGSSVGRETYPELFAAIGTTFGEGDGATTFNLPDLIGRFAEGSAMPGTVKEAGLPNIEGYACNALSVNPDGVFSSSPDVHVNIANTSGPHTQRNIYFNASVFNPIYGNSDTVQPPALTLLPCIKAFDATVNTGLVDITALAQEVANKTDKNTAAHVGMPSEQAIALTPQKEGTYVAPADGYFYFAYGEFTGNGQGYMQLRGTLLRVQTSSESLAGNWRCCYIPIRKGDSCYLSYSTDLSGTNLWFIYAEGSKP